MLYVKIIVIFNCRVVFFLDKGIKVGVFLFSKGGRGGKKEEGKQEINTKGKKRYLNEKPRYSSWGAFLVLFWVIIWCVVPSLYFTDMAPRTVGREV